MVCAVELAELLMQAGARLRGSKRADCPRCGGKRTIAFTEETFFCHHDGCHWSGNAITLARELGTELPRLADEELFRQRIIGQEAERVRHFIRMRWGFLRDLNWLLMEIERLARESSQEYIQRGEPVSESVWANLEWTLREQEKIWPELVLFAGPQSGSGEPARWVGIMLERYEQSKLEGNRPNG